MSKEKEGQDVRELNDKKNNLQSPEPSSGKWAADAQDELEDWIEEQGIQLRY